ncbi:MAG: lipopolysaccharide transport periplasmic protein LptA [Pseudomonadota bacterium]
MKKLLAFTLAFAFGAAVSGSLQAQAPAAKPAPKRNSTNADINISSDTFQADLNAKTGTYSGNVIVTQGDIKLRANSVRVTTVNGDADKVTATGNVVVDSPASGTVTGENGVYEVKPKTVTMNGNVVLRKGREVTMRGARLTVNLVTGQANLGGGVKGQGTAGGRVQGVFRPNSGGANTQ